MAQTVSASFPDRPSAERGAADLKAAGFPDAQIGMMSQEHTGPTDVADRLKPNKRSVPGAIIGAVVLGVVGFILGWLFIQALPGIAHGGIPALLGALVAAAIGVVAGLVLGPIVATRAPVEEAYYRARREEAGATRVVVEAAGREDEARRILRGAGGRDVAAGDDEARRRGAYGTDTAHGALT